MQLFDEIDKVTTDYRRVVLGIEDEPEYGNCCECGCPDCEYDEFEEDFICEDCKRKLSAEYAESCFVNDPRRR